MKKKKTAHLTNGQHVVDVQAFEQGPHGKVDIDQPPAKVKTTGEPCDDLETGILVIGGSRSSGRRTARKRSKGSV